MRVPLNILTVNLLFRTLVFWIAAKIYLIPRLHELRPRSVLLPILLLHAFRHLGLMFLAPGGTYAGIDRKSTRLNSSHGYISYAVFCLKKKNNTTHCYTDW